MTKTSIVRTVSEEIELTRVQTKQIVQKVFDAIVRILVGRAAGRATQLRRFRGAVAEAPQGANPRTGEKLTAPEMRVTFKPGRLMQERVEAESRTKRPLTQSTRMDRRQRQKLSSDQALDVAVNTLVKDGRVEIHDFGVLKARWRKPAKARNPRTSENGTVPPRGMP